MPLRRPSQGRIVVSIGAPAALLQDLEDCGRPRDATAQSPVSFHQRSTPLEDSAAESSVRLEPGPEALGAKHQALPDAADSLAGTFTEVCFEQGFKRVPRIKEVLSRCTSDKENRALKTACLQQGFGTKEAWVSATKAPALARAKLQTASAPDLGARRARRDLWTAQPAPRSAARRASEPRIQDARRPSSAGFSATFKRPCSSSARPHTRPIFCCDDDGLDAKNAVDAANPKQFGSGMRTVTNRAWHSVGRPQSAASGAAPAAARARRPASAPVRNACVWHFALDGLG